MKSPLFLLFLFLCSSCTFVTDNIFGNFPDSNNFLHRFPENEKALVILKNHAENLFWCKVESQNHNIKREDHCVKVRTSDLNQIVMLDPGIYKLMDYTFTKEQYIFGKTRKNLSSKSSLTINVDAGEILYVGLIERVGVKYKAEDEFLNLKKAFKSNNYQELQSSLKLSVEEVEWLVNIYKKNPAILKEKLAEAVEYKTILRGNSKNDSSCKSVCNLDFVERIEQDLKLNKNKYNQKYVNKLERELKQEKSKCVEVRQIEHSDKVGDEDD